MLYKLISLDVVMKLYVYALRYTESAICEFVALIDVITRLNCDLLNNNYFKLFTIIMLVSPIIP